MGEIKKVSLKPGFEDCYWRTFEYCSRKWVPYGRSWVTETTSGEVSFGERLIQQTSVRRPKIPHTVASLYVSAEIGWRCGALDFECDHRHLVDDCLINRQPVHAVQQQLGVGFGARSKLRCSACVEVSGWYRSERRTGERCSSRSSRESNYKPTSMLVPASGDVVCDGRLERGSCTTLLYRCACFSNVSRRNASRPRWRQAHSFAHILTGWPQRQSQTGRLVEGLLVSTDTTFQRSEPPTCRGWAADRSACHVPQSHVGSAHSKHWQRGRCVVSTHGEIELSVISILMVLYAVKISDTQKS